MLHNVKTEVLTIEELISRAMETIRQSKLALKEFHLRMQEFEDRVVEFESQRDYGTNLLEPSPSSDSDAKELH